MVPNSGHSYPRGYMRNTGTPDFYFFKNFNKIICLLITEVFFFRLGLREQKMVENLWNKGFDALSEDEWSISIQFSSWTILKRIFFSLSFSMAWDFLATKSKKKGKKNWLQIGTGDNLMKILEILNLKNLD